MSGAVAAVDLGATSGRVIVGHVGPGTLRLSEVHRFPNAPLAVGDGLVTDISALYREVIAGLRRASAGSTPIESVGVDGWAVDHGLLDADGELIAEPRHYRDPRHAAGVDAVHAVVSPDELWARTGLAQLPFNTVYQLAAELPDPALAHARTMLLLPDLVGHRLTGVAVGERTNASTTSLLDVRTGEWAWSLVDALGLPRALFPPLRNPGTPLGPIRESVAADTGLAAGTPVVLVGSHATASAVVAVPAVDDRFAFVSCGTWSLVGVELAGPVVTEAARAAGFTNERGVDGTTRFLRNVMGLWLLSESMRTWAAAGRPEDLDRLLGAAAALPAGGPVIDPDDPVFLQPGDMPRRISDWCARADQPLPVSRPAMVRCILDSLALACARTIERAIELSGRDVEAVHLVGGGSRNRLLCQLTADACGRPVIAGPAEATAIGNVLVQARSLGHLAGDLGELRALVRATQPLQRFEPRRTGVVRMLPGA